MLPNVLLLSLFCPKTQKSGVITPNGVIAPQLYFVFGKPSII
jgi:hypothetical protein